MFKISLWQQSPLKMLNNSLGKTEFIYIRYLVSDVFGPVAAGLFPCCVWPFTPLLWLFSCRPMVSQQMPPSPRQIIQFYYMGWLTCSFFSVHWTFSAIKAHKHRICLTIVRLCDSHRSILPLSHTRTLCPFHSCILLNFQQQYAKAHHKKKNEREKIKKNKNSYEIVANEIILTFKCVYTRDKLALFFSLYQIRIARHQ